MQLVGPGVFGVDEWHGTNAFIRDGENAFRTYFINSRGDEQMGSTWNYFDITALGRQQKWGDSPEGYPQTPPYEWWNCTTNSATRRHSRAGVQRSNAESRPGKHGDVRDCSPVFACRLNKEAGRLNMGVQKRWLR